MRCCAGLRLRGGDKLLSRVMRRSLRGDLEHRGVLRRDGRRDGRRWRGGDEPLREEMRDELCDRDLRPRRGCAGAGAFEALAWGCGYAACSSFASKGLWAVLTAKSFVSISAMFTAGGFLRGRAAIAGRLDGARCRADRVQLRRTVGPNCAGRECWRHRQRCLRCDVFTVISDVVRVARVTERVDDALNPGGDLDFRRMAQHAVGRVELQQESAINGRDDASMSHCDVA